MITPRAFWFGFVALVGCGSLLLPATAFTHTPGSVDCVAYSTPLPVGSGWFYTPYLQFLRLRSLLPVGWFDTTARVVTLPCTYLRLPLPATLPATTTTVSRGSTRFTLPHLVTRTCVPRAHTPHTHLFVTFPFTRFTHHRVMYAHTAHRFPLRARCAHAHCAHCALPRRRCHLPPPPRCWFTRLRAQHLRAPRTAPYLCVRTRALHCIFHFYLHLFVHCVTLLFIYLIILHTLHTTPHFCTLVTVTLPLRLPCAFFIYLRCLLRLLVYITFTFTFTFTVYTRLRLLPHV